MKPLTFTRGAWLACVAALTLALTASPALAASSGTHAAGSGTHAAGSGTHAASSSTHAAAQHASAQATAKQTSALATKYGANTPLHLSTTGAATTHTSSSGFGGSIIRTIVGLLIVIAVIYGLTWIIRQSKKPKTAAVGDGLEQVAALPLGTNRSVALVRVGDELHLLGVAEHGITGIRVFSEDEAYELGLPFHSDEGDYAGRGPVPIQRMVDALRRLTLR